MSSEGLETLLRQLSDPDRQPFDARRVGVVVAHPDDECAALGAQLARMRGVTLLHVTAGAPRDPQAALRLGLSGPDDYAALRTRELTAALKRVGIAASHRQCLGFVDQEVVQQLPALVQRLRLECAARALTYLITHAFEGGHPDHDAVACACSLVPGVELLEVPLYRLGQGAFAIGSFPDRPIYPEHAAELSEAEQLQKVELLSCFASQALLLAFLDLRQERFRAAPQHNFHELPNQGELAYELLGWMRGTEWLEHARRALE